jgi:hypothetical protein
MFSKQLIIIGGLSLIANVFVTQVFGGEPPFGAMLSYEPATQIEHLATPYPFGALLAVETAVAADSEREYPFGALLGIEMEVSQRRSQRTAYPFGDLLTAMLTREPRVVSYPFGALLVLSPSPIEAVAEYANSRGGGGGVGETR